MENNNFQKKWDDPAKTEKLHNPERLLSLPPNLIWEMLSPDVPDVVVDIGAGTGLFSTEFFKLMGNGILYACDISDTMIDWLNSKVHSEYPGILPVKMSKTAVPLDNDIADLVFMMNLHHELKDPLILLGEAKRLLKPDGKICIVDWKRGAAEDGPGPADSVRYETKIVADQLREAGFKYTKIYEGLNFHFVVHAAK
jgi:SAM-dependent methyltransferase